MILFTNYIYIYSSLKLSDLNDILLEGTLSPRIQELTQLTKLAFNHGTSSRRTFAPLPKLTNLTNLEYLDFSGIVPYGKRMFSFFQKKK